MNPDQTVPVWIHIVYKTCYLRSTASNSRLQKLHKTYLMPFCTTGKIMKLFIILCDFSFEFHIFFMPLSLYFVYRYLWC